MRSPHTSRADTWVCPYHLKMRLSFEEIAKATGGKLQGNSKKIVSQIATDTRVIKAGDLYVALKGPNFDGHDFIADAKSKGAIGAVVSKKISGGADFVVIEVKDTLKALGDIAHFWRKKFSIPVIAITGSSGKTSTKEMLAACLEEVGPISKTEGNLNNLVGVPLTLFNLKEGDRFAIIEMGMNAFGEIARLTEIAAPTVGLITNVGSAHLEGVGDLAGVAKAKGELFKNLGPQATAVMNSDDPYISKMETAAKKVTFGFSKKAMIQATGIDYGDKTMKVEIGGASFNLPFVAEHQAKNWLATYAVCTALGVVPSQKSLGKLKPAKMRGEEIEVNGVTVINDAYNANPDSMKAALMALQKKFPSKRKIAVLGEMMELGAQTAALHEKVGEYAASEGIEILMACGAHAKEMKKGFDLNGGKSSMVFADPDELQKTLKKSLKKGDAVLIKGSRLSRMEKIIDFLCSTTSSIH